MSAYTIKPGTLIDNGEEACFGIVIDPAWTDEQIADAWNSSSSWYGDPVAPPFTRRRLWAHSARQLREQPQPCDSWWSEEGELQSNITVAEES